MMCSPACNVTSCLLAAVLFVPITTEWVLSALMTHCHVVCYDLVLSSQIIRQYLRVCAACAEGAVIHIAYSTATALAGVGLLVGDWVLVNQVWYIISEEDIY